jgi:hypothetical protein
MGIKLNAQVIIKNPQNMHAKSIPPTPGARRRMELESLALTVLGLGPPARQGVLAQDSTIVRTVVGM